MCSPLIINYKGERTSCGKSCRCMYNHSGFNPNHSSSIVAYQTLTSHFVIDLVDIHRDRHVLPNRLPPSSAHCPNSLSWNTSMTFAPTQRDTRTFREVYLTLHSHDIPDFYHWRRLPGPFTKFRVRSAV